jgi:hypothetical protein
LASLKGAEFAGRIEGKVGGILHHVIAVSASSCGFKSRFGQRPKSGKATHDLEQEEFTEGDPTSQNW